MIYGRMMHLSKELTVNLSYTFFVTLVLLAPRTTTILES